MGKVAAEKRKAKENLGGHLELRQAEGGRDVPKKLKIQRIGNSPQRGLRIRGRWIDD